MKTQAQTILSYLQSGNSLTQLQATKYWNICCLAERIRDLRRMGKLIESTPVVRNGKRHVQYKLISTP